MAIPTDGPKQYLVGQTAEILGDFLDDDGDHVDPDPESVIIYVTPANGATLKYGYPTGPDGDITQDDTGEYSLLQSTGIQAQSGAEKDRWYYRVEGSSASLGLTWAEEYWFDVLPTNITPYVE